MSQLPPGWTTATLGDLIARDGLFSDGDWVETKDQDPSGNVRLTQLADVGEGVFRDRSSRFLRDDQAAALNCTFLEPGDVLIARMPEPLGRACLLPVLTQPAVTAVDVCIVRPGSGSVDPRWLMWTINAPTFRGRLMEFQTGTTRRRISRKNLARIEFPVPPLNEQRRIVAAIEAHLSRLDAADASLAAALRRLDALHESALTTAVAGQPTAALGSVTSAHRYGTSIKCLADAPGPAVLRIPNVRGGRIDLTDLKRATSEDVGESTVEAGDLLFIRTNGSRDLIGRVAAVEGAAGLAFASYLIRARPNQSLLDPRWAVIALSARPLRAEIESRAASTAGQYNLNLKSLRSLEIPLPPLSEQKRIVAEVEERLSKIDAMRASIKRAQRRSKALRAAILERAFRGELVPQDPSDEPAEALLARIRADRASSRVPSGRG